MPKESRQSLQNTSVSIRIPIAPLPKARPRFSRISGAYTDPKYLKNEMQLATYLAHAWSGEPIDQALSLKVEIYLKRPKSAKRRDYPHTRPDLDNYLKAVMDACSRAKIWTDDSLVCSLHGSKNYATKDPYTLIRFKVLDSPGIIS